MSALTEYYIDRRMTGYNAHAATPPPTFPPTYADTSQAPPKQQQLLEVARKRAPDYYKHLNDGKGLKFIKYCWKCGVNCTHWTRRCYELSEADRARYADANFDNTMGGNRKFLERKDKYQKDYGFDSL
jgi:hypothetical protein